MTQEQHAYRFLPRPEAQPMKWSDLLPPVRRAVHELLMRIAGAETARRSGGGTGSGVGNCFLVYGARGTGKTTVLLSARFAVQHPEPGDDFFSSSEQDLEAFERDARACALDLKNEQHIVWLEPLDLEPLPPTANLLTTLLTRVRGALDAGGEYHEQTRTTSIFEESAGDARQQLGELINDATLMWEEIREQDTRNTALRQRAAADIYAGFSERYKRAMDALSKKLDLRHRGDQGCAIILPIDNIDRSPEHLKAIVKLAQMVAHPCLRLVMAGDRVEVTNFLERAYWRELIEGRAGTDARGKPGQAGEDESEGMARRQAQAMAQKVWPPSHRIEVDALQPRETLDFRRANGEPPLRELLKAVKVPCFIVGEGREKQTIDFVDLFELPASAADTDEPSGRLTRAARHAMCLPARVALDLWQLAHRVAADNFPHGAVKIARTMLRTTAAGSSLPNGLVRPLQEDAVQRDANGGTLINVEGWDFRAKGVLSVSATIIEPAETLLAQGLAIRSSLFTRDTHDMLVHLQLRDWPLPELVGAWLAILYDVLYWVPELAVLGRASIDAPIVEVSHEAVACVNDVRCRGSARWPWSAPRFSTFDAHANFWRHWEGFRADDKARCSDKGCRGHPCPTLQLRGWLRCVLRTVEESGPPRVRASTLADRGKSLEGVFDEAAALYAEVKAEGERKLPTRRHFESTAVCEWFERELPLLLTRLYTPAGATAKTEPAHRCHHRLLEWVVRHRKEPLVAQWSRDGEFLWADLDARLEQMFAAPTDADTAAASGTRVPMPPAQRAALQDWAYGEFKHALG